MAQTEANKSKTNNILSAYPNLSHIGLEVTKNGIIRQKKRAYKVKKK